MKLHRGYPPASDRMGFLWALGSVEGLCIIEFGPEGTTRYLLESFSNFNSPSRAHIFTTMMDEDVVIMGNNDRLLRALREIDTRHNPAFMLVMDSSVAAVTGIDMVGLCHEYQPGVNARLLPISGGGLRASASNGIEQALLFLTSIAEERENIPHTFNLLGVCADEFNAAAEADEIITLIATAFGWQPHIVLPLRASMESCKTLGCAALNIVLRDEAIPAAKKLQERFGTPYVSARPYGLQGTLDFLEKLSNITGQVPAWHSLAQTRDTLEKALTQGRMALTHGGSSVYLNAPAYAASGLQTFVCKELGGILANTDATPEKIRQTCLVLADGLTLRHAKRAAVQTDFPIIDSRYAMQAALSGFGGAARISHLLKGLNRAF